MTSKYIKRCVTKFKFHFDSINIFIVFNPILIYLIFKFHFDSINIDAIQHLLGDYSNLNSTVIPLILIPSTLTLTSSVFKFHCDSINIEKMSEKCRMETVFKFHFDSINIFIVFNPILIYLIFKFHFDSINMFHGMQLCLISRTALNSTVILLILIAKRTSFLFPSFKFHCDSINIGITLSDLQIVGAFKFHCDSINIEKY